MKHYFLVLSLLLSLTLAALPANFTWANVNATNFLGINQNQNQPNRCESGWAFATINTLNSRLKLRMAQTGFSSPDVSLSVQVLLECDTNDFGCLGGEPASALRWIKNNNITDESCNYYKAKGYTNGLSCSAVSKCQICTQKQKCSPQVNSKVYALGKTGSVSGQSQIIKQIYDFGPVTCGIAFTQELKNNYTKGIFNDKTKATRFNHYVSIYGWGEENGVKFWNVMNSFGPGWGEEGNFKILRGVNNLGIESLCYWSSFISTWVNDQRNNTLPGDTVEISDYKAEPLPLPKWLSPSKSIHSPNHCDASWAFAITHMLSDRNYKASKGISLRSFSVQALINCGVGTCEKAANPFEVLVFIHKYGVPEEGCQNYKAETPAKESCSAINNCATCGGNSIYKQNCTEVKNYKRWKIIDYGTLVGAAQMKMEIDNYGPIVCGIQNSHAFQKYKSGVFSETSISPKIDYFVEILGYSGSEYWVGRNFQGTAWGLGGYFKLKMGGSNLGVESKCYWSGSQF